MSAPNDLQRPANEAPTTDAPTAEAPTTEAPPDATWLSQPERGALLGIQLVFTLATLFGRWPARQLVRVIAAWYWLFDRAARRASEDWLRTVFEREPTRREVYTHLNTFAQVTLDRIFLLKGKTRAFDVTRTGNQHLLKLRDTRQGAILLGAHLGSFEAMRVGGDEEALDIHIVGNFENAKMINALLDRLDPEMRARVIDIGADPMTSTLTMKARVEEGAMVAILGDRVAPNSKVVEARFFGRPAYFPVGPFILASLLRCPVYLVFGLYRPPRGYDLFCEPFAERVELPRANRQEGLEAIVQKYADRLEDYARRAPYSWFNFYDFWKSPDA